MSGWVGGLVCSVRMILVPDFDGLMGLGWVAGVCWVGRWVGPLCTTSLVPNIACWVGLVCWVGCVGGFGWECSAGFVSALVGAGLIDSTLQ